MRNWNLAGKLALGLVLAAASAQAASLTVPAGTPISVRMVDSVDSKKNYIGETFYATLDAALMVDGRVAIPRGAQAVGRLVDVEEAGRLQGRSRVAIELTALNFDGQSVAIRTSSYQEAASSQSKETAKMAGGGGLLGAIIGAIAGGKKGTLIGAGAGAAGGTVVQTIRGAEQVSIPAESLVIFTLQSPVVVSAGN